MADWKKIKSEYIRGASYRTLADKYGVSFSSIQKRGMREKWTDLRKLSGRKRDEIIVEKIASQESKRIDSVQSIADLLLEKIKQGVEDGTFVSDTQSIRQITASIKDLRDIKGMKNELDIQEQMARIEKLRKEASAENESNEIKVVIESSLDEYAN